MQESGCRLEHPSAAKFRESVMAGDWERVSLYGIQFNMRFFLSLLGSFADNASFNCLYGRFTLFHFSFCKADAILKELRPLVENKEDISVSIILKRT